MPATSMTLHEVAEALGVHYMTAYRYVRQGRLPGTRQGNEWRIDPADVALLRAAAPPRRGAGRSGDHPRALARRMLAGDAAGAWWLVESRLGSGLDPAGVLTDMVVPALRAIGDRWQKGGVSIAEEHRATLVAQRIVGRLGLQFGRRGKHRGVIALAAPASDLHTLPVSIAADLLRWRGFEVLELGANTPAESLAEAVGREPSLVAVGIASTTGGDGHEAEVADSVRSVRAARPDIPIFVGGAAIRSAAHARALGADRWTGKGANAVVGAVEEIVGPPERGARHVA